MNGQPGQSSVLANRAQSSDARTLRIKQATREEKQEENPA
jgi:hypothetical protein